MQLKYISKQEREALLRDFLAQLEAAKLRDATNNLLNLNADLTIDQKILLLEKFKEEIENGNQ